MPDAVSGGGQTQSGGGAVANGAGAGAPAPVATPPAGPSGGVPQNGAAQEWRIGDQTFRTPDEVVRAAQRWHGEHTKLSQERAREKQDYQLKSQLWDFINSDPELVAEVRARIRAGQSPQAAARGAIQNQQQGQQQQAEPQVDPRVDQMWNEIDTYKQEMATQQFLDAHKDITPQEKEMLEGVIEKYAPYFDSAKGQDGNPMSYAEMLNMAWGIVFQQSRAASLLAQGQQMKEREIRNGQGARTLGSQAASAGARIAQKTKRGNEMSPKERMEYATQVFNENKGRQ